MKKNEKEMGTTPPTLYAILQYNVFWWRGCNEHHHACLGDLYQSTMKAENMFNY